MAVKNGGNWLFGHRLITRVPEYVLIGLAFLGRLAAVITIVTTLTEWGRRVRQRRAPGYSGGLSRPAPTFTSSRTTDWGTISPSGMLSDDGVARLEHLPREALERYRSGRILRADLERNGLS